jgi:hypothetical protein
MIKNNKWIWMNLYWNSKQLVVVFILSILLTSCQPISASTIQANPTPTTNQQPSVTATQQTSQIPTVTTTQQPAQVPTVTPIQPTVQPQTATPTVGVSPVATQPSNGAKIKTVFIIMMENHNWSDILNNPSAPYINQTLLPQASYALQYVNLPGIHPSEPNYLWLEAGTSFGITNDGTPQNNHQSSTDHLVTYLDKAGITWKAYQEGISGKVCPLKGVGLYAPKHNPMVYFDNVTNNNDPNSTYCIAHERPFTELQSDLANGTVSQYNFITPNLCNDMHDTDGCPTQDAVKNGDTWLSEQVPIIMGSSAYQQGGVIFITWDESENGDHPIGMIVLSPFAKGGGYSNSIPYTHSSTLRTIEEIFNITPLLGDTSKATDLSDLFSQFP